MALCWLLLALSSTAEALGRYDWSWDAALVCVEAGYALDLCPAEVGAASDCERQLVDWCLLLTGADER